MATSAEIAQLIADQGRLAAEGRRRVGQIYGNLFSNIGTTIGNIPAQLQEQKILQANAAIRNQQMQIGQFQLQSAQRAQMGQQVLAKAIQQYPDDPKAVAREVSKFSPELGTEYLKGQSDLATHAANLDELNRKRLAADSALLGDAAFQSEQSPDPSVAFTARLAAFKNRLSPETLKQLQKVQTPEDAEAFRKARIQDSPLWQEQQKERTKVRDIHEGDVVGSIAGGVMMRGQPKPKTPTELLTDAANPESPTQAQSAAALKMKQEMTPYQEAQLKETQRLRAIEQQNANTSAARLAAESATVKLTPGGLDMAAVLYKKTGQLPALGMGNKAAFGKTEVINRARELTPEDVARIEAGGVDIASNKAAFAANEGALKQLQRQRDAIGAFEETAKKNIDIFLGTAGKVVDTGSPLANTLVRNVSGKILGSPNQAAYDTARQVAVNEVAKIITNPNLSGQLSDQARKEVEAFNPSNATLAQSVAVMRLLKRDMDNRTQALDDQIATIKGRIGGGGKTAPVGAEEWVRDKNGKIVKKGG